MFTEIWIHTIRENNRSPKYYYWRDVIAFNGDRLTKSENVGTPINTIDAFHERTDIGHIWIIHHENSQLLKTMVEDFAFVRYLRLRNIYAKVISEKASNYTISHDSQQVAEWVTKYQANLHTFATFCDKQKDLTSANRVQTLYRILADIRESDKLSPHVTGQKLHQLLCELVLL